MKVVSITDAKNGLSAYLERVRAGETVLITERGVPIARLGPIATSEDPVGRRSRLVRAGLARSGTGSMPRSLKEAPATAMPDGESIVDVVLEERASGW
jgi:prevent-host-death family protein